MGFAKEYAWPMALALPELEEFDRLVEAGGARVEVRTLCEVVDARARYPLRAAYLGNPAPDAPAVGFFGGVHGLERIGTQVLLSYLGALIARLGKDERLEQLLERMRLIFMPLVNPAGMVRSTRANANGVDLMRNAPVESRERVAFLLGGQRLTSLLPWYRGAYGTPMEVESAALCDLVRAELLSRPFSLALDCHSGFGLRDRIWFPHAHTRDPFSHLAEVHALKARFDAAYPKHLYLFEPQSRRYLTHGDLWDYLHAEAVALGRVFLPLTLEMGSWRWIRKSPRQILSRLGIFNPLPPDRARRVRKNHIEWLDFLCRAALNRSEWLPAGDLRARHQELALTSWFGPAA
jgi:Zinc carboxypeptidase